MAIVAQGHSRVTVKATVVDLITIRRNGHYILSLDNMLQEFTGKWETNWSLWMTEYFTTRFPGSKSLPCYESKKIIDIDCQSWNNIRSNRAFILYSTLILASKYCVSWQYITDDMFSIVLNGYLIYIMLVWHIICGFINIITKNKPLLLVVYKSRCGVGAQTCDCTRRL